MDSVRHSLAAVLWESKTVFYLICRGCGSVVAAAAVVKAVVVRTVLPTWW